MRAMDAAAAREMQRERENHSVSVPAALSAYQTGHNTLTNSSSISYKQLIKISHENIMDYVHIF